MNRAGVDAGGGERYRLAIFVGVDVRHYELPGPGDASEFAGVSGRQMHSGSRITRIQVVRLTEEKICVRSDANEGCRETAGMQRCVLGDPWWPVRG
jgi:hypothetical protein